MKRIGVIGDLHGCIDEFQEMLHRLEHESLDEIWCTGDFVDRGPDSGACVELARVRNVRGIEGNHESVLLELRARAKRTDHPDKRGTLESIRGAEDWAYLSALPFLHVDDALGVVLVHGGIFPRMAIHKTPKRLACRLQMIDPLRMDHTAWFNMTRDGEKESELRKRGYVRWYEVYDHAQDVFFGHSVFKEPLVHQGCARGRAIGLDTGCVFGGKLTACIYPDMKFISVPAKRAYAERRAGQDSAHGVDL